MTISIYQRNGRLAVVINKESVETLLSANLLEKGFRKAGFLPTYLTQITRGRFYDSPLGGAYHPLIGSCFLFPEGDQSSRGGPCSRSSEAIFPRALRTLSAAGPKAFRMPATSHDGPLCGF